jgi:hypothetical protein
MNRAEEPKKDWEKFGRDVWDAAMHAHKVGITKVIVPIHLDDGGICRVEVTPPTYVDVRTVQDAETSSLRREFRYGKKMSDGEIEWGAWS